MICMTGDDELQVVFGANGGAGAASPQRSSLRHRREAAERTSP
jgi:hypothetical protein